MHNMGTFTGERQSLFQLLYPDPCHPSDDAIDRIQGHGSSQKGTGLKNSRFDGVDSHVVRLTVNNGGREGFEDLNGRD